MRNELFDRLCGSLEQLYALNTQVGDIITWAVSLLLDGRPFSLEGHEYQRDLLTENARRQVFLKGAQVGITSIQMIKTLFGLITGRFPQGALYLFPSRGDVADFSRGRFNPLINDNPDVAKFVLDTDAQGIKRVGKSMLYMRGARSTAKIGGMKRSSTALKSIPVDRVCFDERDEMADDMVDLALERMSHSAIKEEIHLSTPSIPDYGVDKLFQKSDQRYWFIKCEKCGGETCLELEFPGCLEELSDGRIIRLCQRCRNNEIHPKDGQWVSFYPNRSKGLVGWRISQLNSMFVDPGTILKLYLDPPNGNLSEVMNSKLAQAHIAAENRLTVSEVIDLCGDTPNGVSDPGPCYLGCDVGSLLHVVVARRSRDKAAKVIFIGAIKAFKELDSLMKRFNVARAVVDALPETRLARDFARRHNGRVFCCFYQEHQKGGYAWNERELTVSANRTESLDASHNELAQGNVILPSQSETMQEFARHCANVARVLQTDPETGSSRYVYIKTGLDHYRHAWNYAVMGLQFAIQGFFGKCDLG
jgi:hypothetical protein